MSSERETWLAALKVALAGLVDEVDLLALSDENAAKLATLGIRRLRAELGGVEDGLSLSIGHAKAERLIARARGQAVAAAAQATDEEVAQAVKEHTGK